MNTENELKEYTVNVHYDAMVTVKVYATSEDEALERAQDKANELDNPEFEYDYTDACVTSVDGISKGTLNIHYGFPKHTPKYTEEYLKSLSPKHIRELACEDDERVYILEGDEEYNEYVEMFPNIANDYTWIVVNV